MNSPPARPAKRRRLNNQTAIVHTNANATAAADNSDNKEAGGEVSTTQLWMLLLRLIVLDKLVKMTRCGNDNKNDDKKKSDGQAVPMAAGKLTTASLAPTHSSVNDQREITPNHTQKKKVRFMVGTTRTPPRPSNTQGRKKVRFLVDNGAKEVETGGHRERVGKRKQ